MSKQTIYSVSQLNQQVRLQLEQKLGLIWLTGEISNFSQPVSGHWYFTLKDENAQVRCAMFRGKNLRVGYRVQNGMQVLVRANVSLYEPRGDYQLIVESLHLAGEGLLQQQFEALKQKLSAEGLFAQHFKKSLPPFAQTVGIITSQTGAALQDILNVLARRDPNLAVVIYPCAVQGKEAGDEIVEMIELANRRREVDVLIVGRGGGSLEDLACFNQEQVARAIFHSALPIISAVGHETDVTIADFVADIRAATPSAAAEIISRDQKQLQQQWQAKTQYLEMAIDRLLQGYQQGFAHLHLRLQAQHPLTKLQQQIKHIQQLVHRLSFAWQHLSQKKLQKHTALLGQLQQTPLIHQLQQQQQYWQQLQVRLNFAINQQQQQRQYRLAQLTHQLDSLSPLKALQQQWQAKIQYLAMAIERLLQRHQQGFAHLSLRLQAQHPLTKLQQQIKHIQQLVHRLSFAWQHLSQKKLQKHTALLGQLQQTPLIHQLQQQQQYWQQLQVRLNFAIKQQQQQPQYRLAQLAHQLDSLSPLKVLTRGYSITKSMDNQLIRHVAEVKPTQKIKTQLQDGYLVSQIIEVKKKKIN